jgi:hypothetical protein
VKGRNANSNWPKPSLGSILPKTFEFSLFIGLASFRLYLLWCSVGHIKLEIRSGGKQLPSTELYQVFAVSFSLCLDHRAAAGA